MTIEGFDNVIAKLATLGADVPKVAAQAVEKAASIVEGDAIENCPVDTGNLREQIHTTVEDDGASVTASVGSPVEYAPYVEFGTGQRGAQADLGDVDVDLAYTLEKNGEPYMGQEPQPFLYPALRANEEQVKEVIADTLKGAIDQCKT